MQVTETSIINVRMVLPGGMIAPGSLQLREGRISSISTHSSFHSAAETSPAAVSIDGGGRLLTPGLIDIHTHGIGTCLYERGPEDLLSAGHLLARHGTTCVLPTLYRVMNRPSLKLLERLAAALNEAVDVSMPGFHLEGPFLALPGAGAHTIAGDVGLLKELFDACSGRVCAMSISPETPNILPVIEWLVARQVVPLMTHTRASAEQTEAAIEAGARHATHFYDVFPMPPESEPGVRPVGAVEAILADPRVSVDFIADGVHVHPAAIRAALAAKGYEGIVLITDSIIGAGLPAGVHETPWGFSLRVEPGDAARIAGDHPRAGGLAGSALSMDAGVQNLMRWLDLPPAQVWAMATSNPARIMGLRGKGVIAVGADADLVLWDDNLKPVKTWVGGHLMFDQETQKEAAHA
jgi:N-acetylglucosamine-6-phosphate deacetylase